MKKFRYILMAFAGLAMVSCDSFLDREPLDFGDEDSYFNTATDLQLSVNKFYENLPLNNNLWGGLYSEDTNADTQFGSGSNELFYPGRKKAADIEASTWYKSFQKLRGINFFINKTEGKLDKITGQESLINQYLGEAYFFRAYEHFVLLRNYGDAPIVTEMQIDDRPTLAENSRRYPRNEVARFILSDLDHAIELMLENPTASGRVADDAAYALKARVALYEATWEKYHANTCFVPGNAKWVGASSNPDFAFKAGSAEAEINFFLDQAIAAAEYVAERHPLAATPDEYFAMFNSDVEFPNNSEVILARYYGQGLLHSCSAYLKGGGGCGLTRQAVSSFLMESGLPIYADANYQGDVTSYAEFQGRDKRLTGACRPGGFITGSGPRDTIYYYRPPISTAGRDQSTTGYDLNKWVSLDPAQRDQQGCSTAVPLFRSGEAMLTYIEAYYERHGNLGGKCDSYWRQIRRRSGVDEDYNKTIAATDLAQENNLGKYSRGNLVSPTLYNIRRERMCDLIAEGLRLDDLKRWRSLDSMVDYQPEGFNLWDTMYKMYPTSSLSGTTVSPKDVSTYLRPLQKSATSEVYNGYNFPKPHYLEPIPVSEFLLTGDVLYQNPGWSSKQANPADVSYDCD